MKKNIIKLNESQLKKIVAESVKSVLREAVMADPEEVAKQFIEFIEKHHGGVLLQYIVDCESGNECGSPISPIPSIIPEFEDAILNGRKCTSEERKAIKRAYNQWWYYAQGQLMDGMDEEG